MTLNEVLTVIRQTYPEASSQINASKIWIEQTFNDYDFSKLKTSKTAAELLPLFVSICCYESYGSKFADLNTNFEQIFNDFAVLPYNSNTKESINSIANSLYRHEYTPMQVLPINAVESTRVFRLGHRDLLNLMSLYNRNEIGVIVIDSAADLVTFVNGIKEFQTVCRSNPFYFGFYALANAILIAESGGSQYQSKIEQYIARYNAPYGVPDPTYVPRVKAIYDSIMNKSIAGINAVEAIQRSETVVTQPSQRPAETPTANSTDAPGLVSLMAAERLTYIATLYSNYIVESLESLRKGEHLSIAIPGVNEKIYNLVTSEQILFYFLNDFSLYGFFDQRNTAILDLNSDDLKSLFSLFRGLWLKQVLIKRHNIDPSLVFLSIMQSSNDVNLTPHYFKDVDPPRSRRALWDLLKVELAGTTDYKNHLIVHQYQDKDCSVFRYANYLITFSNSATSFDNGVSASFGILSEAWIAGGNNARN